MTARRFSVFTAYLSFILLVSHGFEVIQPQNRTLNSASISCEHTANVTAVEDVRLNGVSLTGKADQTLLCQKGMKTCQNIKMYEESPNKYVFIILNIGPKAMSMKYECEFTVKLNNLDYTMKGTPTILLPGEKESVCTPHPPPPPTPPSPPPPPPSPQSYQLKWILIGLTALVFLYSCVITSLYIRLKCTDRDPENSTYVVMRKAPLPRSPHFDGYCG